MLALFDAVWEGGNHPIYLDPMVERRRKRRLTERVQDDLILQFIAGETAPRWTDIVGVNRHTATLHFDKLRE